MTARRSLTRLQRAACFERASGRCHICDQRIQVGDPWDVEHVVPLALGGADDESNMRRTDGARPEVPEGRLGAYAGCAGACAKHADGGGSDVRIRIRSHH